MPPVVCRARGRCVRAGALLSVRAAAAGPAPFFFFALRRRAGTDTPSVAATRTTLHDAHALINSPPVVGVGTPASGRGRAGGAGRASVAGVSRRPPQRDAGFEVAPRAVANVVQRTPLRRGSRPTPLLDALALTMCGKASKAAGIWGLLLGFEAGERRRGIERGRINAPIAPSSLLLLLILQLPDPRCPRDPPRRSTAPIRPSPGARWPRS